MTPDRLAHLTDEERRAWEACSGPAWVLSDDSEPHRIGRGSHPGAYPTDAVPFVVGLDAAGQRHMPSLTDLREMVAVRTALPAALEALADARRDLSWHETRHGTCAEQEADDAADAAEEERQKSLTDEQVRAELTALGVDILASRARFDGTLRLCSMLADARRERDEARAELANERGEGEPPSPRWKWTGWAWVAHPEGTDPETGAPNVLSIESTGIISPKGHRTEWYASLNGWSAPKSYPTKRAAMRAADAVVGGAE